MGIKELKSHNGSRGYTSHFLQLSASRQLLQKLHHGYTLRGVPVYSWISSVISAANNKGTIQPRLVDLDG